jgi:succinate-semialdehyde dehydrogenase/glutarate-semialdehyde dehydrogenase
MYPNVSLFIDGAWSQAAAGRTLPIVSPASGDSIGTVAHAERADLDRALEAADKGFRIWRKVSAFDRSKVMRKAANLLRDRADAIAPLLTMEQGKPLPEAKGEVLAAADVIDWFAEEARRTYGRVIPARAEGVYQLVVKEPVGPVAAFTPWNFPINQVVRKLSCALAAGCSIIVKAPEETPASPAELIRCFADAGVPAGVMNLVYGVPSEISEYLIPHPIIRKMSFTGSTAVGKQLAAIAGLHMKRVTMELGGMTPGSQHDRLTIAGTVTVGGMLDVQTINGFNPQPGQSFTLIDNLGSGPILGTFAGIDEGTLFSAGGITYQATYHGGTGNDFVILPVPEPTSVLLVAAAAGGAAWLRGHGRRRGQSPVSGANSGS